MTIKLANPDDARYFLGVDESKCDDGTAVAVFSRVDAQRGVAHVEPLPRKFVTYFYVKVKTVSEANSHEHWRNRQKRAKSQRHAALWAAKAATITNEPRPHVVVRLTRVGRRKLDSDNLQGALKHVRDGVADWLGIDDGRDDLVTWEYAQQTGSDAGVGVEVWRV